MTAGITHDNDNVSCERHLQNKEVVFCWQIVLVVLFLFYWMLNRRRFSLTIGQSQ